MTVDSYRRDDLTFTVSDAGPREGAPVLLLHGFPQDSSSWSQVTPALNDSGLRTLAPDQRGYADTATPRSRRAYSVRELSLDAVALLDAAGLDRAHVVGHDWGGVVAWHLAARHTSRICTATVLSTPHPAAMTWSLLRSRQALMSGYMAAFQLPVLPERYLAPRMRGFYRSTGMPREAANRYAARFADPASLTGPLGWYRALPLTRTRIGRSKVPTTLVWGSEDVALGRVAAERTAHYVAGDYRFVELTAGHWLPETHPVEVADEIVRRVCSGVS